jgi:hypothetical protein
MENLQEATEKICDLKGSLLMHDLFIAAILQVLPENDLARLLVAFEQEAEAARGVLLGAVVSEHTISALERDVQRVSSRIQQALER